VALKFYRTCIGLQDDFYNRQICKTHMFGPIIQIIIDTMPKNNLLNSACLEFFEFIRRVCLDPNWYTAKILISF
jgi:protein phosphatase-4 regulatory subunit 3